MTEESIDFLRHFLYSIAHEESSISYSKASITSALLLLKEKALDY